MNFRRLVITVYLALFLGVAVASGVFFWQAQQEYENLREQERAIRQKLADAEQRLKDQERILERLRTDPTYVERVIRQRLGYAKPDEYIFRIRE
ncbi:MAG: FtsB family cell division protein [Cephaloticoccus sp.]